MKLNNFVLTNLATEVTMCCENKSFLCSHFLFLQSAAISLLMSQGFNH